jgi:hypothetical protein
MVARRMQKPTQAIRSAATASAAEIDLAYGLEPIYEAGSDPRLVALSTFAKIRCPHCFERSEISVETIYGNQRYIQDCQVCCQSIALSVEVDNGTLVKVTAERGDG